MTRKEIIRILRRTGARWPWRVEKYLNLDEIGSGCYRVAYRVAGTNFVLKFTGSCLSHARHEIEVYKMIRRQKKLRHLARFLPRIYYADSKRGVILMEWVPNIKRVSKRECAAIERLFKKAFNRDWDEAGDGDIWLENVGRNGRGQVKIVDWGCV